METPMPTNPLCMLDATEASQKIARREMASEDLVRACLERVAERNGVVHAFTQIKADSALARARALDAEPPRGMLHGLPLGVKDLIDTADFLTTYGSTIYAKHQPQADAAVVALCQDAGAVVLGKTVCTELAYFTPGPTCNPHELSHTPGGSSSGSAAAVADFMVPLALGTQTAGSIIRPAAYCGVVGYKPSLGRVTAAGVKSLSATLDVVGGFARSVRDAGLLGAVLTGDTRLAELSLGGAPHIGLIPTPHWDLLDGDTQNAWTRATALLASHADGCKDVALPADFADLVPLQKEVMAFEMARSLSFERLQHRESLSGKLLELLDLGQAMAGAQHAALLAKVADWRLSIDALFERHDVLLTPSTSSEAPQGLDATGDPLFCRSWTLLGLPCIHLPFSTGSHGLPIGLQLVGRLGHDHRLLACAQWVHTRLLQA
jgi:Asp-tRNA(Asn)/Glu-tRNA(Gln) amidotransferase A subunit family amidase